MARAMVVLALLGALTGCASSYAPSVGGVMDQARFNADLQACRDEATQRKDDNYWAALGKTLIPIYGTAQYFDSDNPSSIPGQHKIIDNCMRARGYSVQ